MNKRSEQLELLDLGSAFYTAEEYEECLQKLYLVGRLTGINRDTKALIKKMAPDSIPGSIVDVGCGGGLFLQEVARCYPELHCTGIDPAPNAIAFAKQFEAKNLRFLCTEAIPEADVVMATLVCHHLTDEQLKEFIDSCYRQARQAVIINDLQRSKVAKGLFALIAPWLFGNRLITHDGQISIERGFTRPELKRLLAPYEYTLRWRLPFRWQIILWKR